jgi:hypothetical protein
LQLKRVPDKQWNKCLGHNTLRQGTDVMI